MAAVTSAATAAAARIGAALSDAQYFESSMVRPEDIRRQLDSRSTKDKLDAMKRVIALISLGKDASMFFPDVVKNVVAVSLEVKKLVYLYLVHYAELKQDLALLAINSFQKDLSDPNQHIRALSLRVLSSIRVKVILQVVILAINNAAKDSSAYVRKAAALAISKVCALDSTSRDLLLDPLQALTSDRSNYVIGSAISAFDDVCPYNWDMIHPHYRRICKNLLTVDPWGQISIINTFLRYARTHFANPYESSAAKSNVSSRNEDLTLLLESVSPLFLSLNHGVVASAMAVYYHLGTADEFCLQAIKPLMRMVANFDDGSQAVALHIAAAVAIRYPQALIPYVSEFYVSPAHSAPIRKLRVKVLLNICASAGRPGGIGSKPEARRSLLAELKEYLFRSDKHLAAASARAIGCFASAHPASTPAIVKVLSSVVASADDPVVVSESIAVLRRLLQRHPNAQTKALPQLISMLLSEGENKSVIVRDAAARSSIIWLITEFYEKVQSIATEALRLLARGFANEAAEVKVQILNLAAKIVSWNDTDKNGPNTTDENNSLVSSRVRHRLLEYVVSCARYDRDYDVRDKARILHSVFISNTGTTVLNAAKKAFLSRKPIPPSADNAEPGDYVDSRLDLDVPLGSMAHVLTGRRLFGFRPLEPWADEDSDSNLRQGESTEANGSAYGRQYIGVSSSSYSQVSSANISNVSWSTSNALQVPPAQSVSHLDRPYEGGGLSVSGIRYAPVGQFSSHSLSRGKRIVDVDPEKFYGDDNDGDDGDEDSSDGESTGEEGDGDEGGQEVKSVDGTSEHRGQQGNSLEFSRSEVQKADSLVGASDLFTSTPDAKPTSEYDLDALLGGLNVSAPGDSENFSVRYGTDNLSSQHQNLSEWFRVLESWNCNGLELDVAYSREISSLGMDVTPVKVRVTNRGKKQVAGFTLISKCGDCFMCYQSIDLLKPGESGEVDVKCRFRGKTSGVRFEVRIQDQIVGEGEFKPSIGFVVRPRPGISPSDFMETEKSLTGMFASHASVNMKNLIQNDWMWLSTTIKDKLVEVCFLSHIKTSVGSRGDNGLERFSSVFAGYLPSMTIGSGDKRPVLLRLTVFALAEEHGCKCDVWIGCEDVLFSANLMRLCRTVLTSISDGE